MNEKLDVLDSAKVPANLLNHDQPLQLLERPKYRADRSIYTRMMIFWKCQLNKLMRAYNS